MKFTHVVAVKDGFMEDGDQFCIKGKKYPIVNISARSYCIISELGVEHWFDDGEDEWFAKLQDNEKPNNMTGEINFTKCGNEIALNDGSDCVDIKIGKGLWLILSREQVLVLKEKLKEVN